ncbi:hypothetical protein GGR57DRAFT_63698 [Xylariaceae sp. FL1272]|nr:hypothetical protein GGR57DRAFT_63698 [Xylariaceae sp. FL1272]
MTADIISSSTPSLEFVERDVTDSDDDSSVASDDYFTDISRHSHRRSNLPPFLPPGALSHSLPPKLAAGIVVGGPARNAPLRSHSAHPLPAFDHRVAPRQLPALPPQRTGSQASGPIRHSGRRITSGSPAPRALQEDSRPDRNGPTQWRPSSKDGHRPDEDPRLAERTRSRLITESFLSVSRKHGALSKAFSNFRSRRTQLEDARRVRIDLEGKFMFQVYALMPRLSAPIKQLYDQLGAARQYYEEAELRFDEVIGDLQRDYEGMESEHRKFYNAAIWAQDVSFADDSVDSDNESEECFALRGISGDRPEIIHPLYGDLRTAFGELQLAKELLANTQMKREALLIRKSQPVGDDGVNFLEHYSHRSGPLELVHRADMTQADHEQLQEYANLEQTALRDIELYTQKVTELRTECKARDVLPHDSIFQGDDLDFSNLNRDEIRLAAGPFDSNECDTLAHPVFPLLLTNPAHLLEVSPQTALQSLKTAISLPSAAPSRQKRIAEAAREANIHSLLSRTKAEDKTDYINRWLLHKLHESAMEAELLWTTFRSRLKILDIERWQRDVLQFWWRDELFDPPAAVVDTADIGKASNSVDPSLGTPLKIRTEIVSWEDYSPRNIDYSWPLQRSQSSIWHNTHFQNMAAT